MTRPGRQELLREAKNNLRVGLLIGLLGGLLLGFLFATATLALNPTLLDATGDVLILTLGLQAVYSVFCLVLGLLGAIGKTAIFSMTGRSLSDTKTAAFVTGSVFFLITATYGYLWCRWHRIGGLAPDHAPTWSELPVLAAIAGVAVLLARLLIYAFYLLIVHFKKPERRQPGDLRKAFFVLLYMTGAFAIFLLALQLSRPSAVSFSGLSKDDIVEAERPVLVLAIDGLGRADIERLLDRSRAEGPANPGQPRPLDWLHPFLEGTHASVTVSGHPIPPVTWTLAATGQSLQAHGIADYQAQLVRGLSRPFTVSPNQVGLFQLFQDVLPFFRLTRPVPMRSYMRGSKGLWNIATDAGLESAIVNWWVSWPAEKIQGRIVSSQAYLRLALAEAEAETGAAGRATREEPAPAGASTPPRRWLAQGETFPGSLLQEIAPLASTAETDSVSRRSGLPPLASALAVFDELGIPAEVLRSDLFYVRAAGHLRQTGDPALSMLYLPGPDVLRRLIDRDLADPSTRWDRWTRATDAYWTALGPALAQALSPADSVVAPIQILLTIPGRHFPGEESSAGFLALAGPGVAATEFPAPIELADFAPTILWLLGLPHSREMDGRPLTEVLGASARSALGPPRVIESYGRQDTREDDPGGADLDQPMLELLRSLGYIDS